MRRRLLLHKERRKAPTAVRPEAPCRAQRPSRWPEGGLEECRPAPAPKVSTSVPVNSRTGVQKPWGVRGKIMEQSGSGVEGFSAAVPRTPHGARRPRASARPFLQPVLRAAPYQSVLETMGMHWD